MAQVTDFYIQTQERNSQFHMQEPDYIVKSLSKASQPKKKKLYYEQKFWQDKDDTSCSS